MRKMAVEKLKLESNMSMEDKMVYKQKNKLSIDDPLKEDSDSSPTMDDNDLLDLLKNDAIETDKKQGNSFSLKKLKRQLILV